MYNEDIMVLFDKVEELSERIESLILKAELWQFLFDESPDGIALFDDKMRFFMVNREFCAITSFESEDLIGKKIDLVLPKRMRRQHRGFEKMFVANPEKRVNRHGLKPYINDKYGNDIAVSIDLSFFQHDGVTYYVVFVRRR